MKPSAPAAERRKFFDKIIGYYRTWSEIHLYRGSWWIKNGKFTILLWYDADLRKQVKLQLWDFNSQKVLFFEKTTNDFSHDIVWWAFFFAELLLSGCSNHFSCNRNHSIPSNKLASMNLLCTVGIAVIVLINEFYTLSSGTLCVQSYVILISIASDIVPLKFQRRRKKWTSVDVNEKTEHIFSLEFELLNALTFFTF